MPRKKSDDAERDGSKTQLKHQCVCGDWLREGQQAAHQSFCRGPFAANRSQKRVSK